jgi:hypothetical protein
LVRRTKSDFGFRKRRILWLQSILSLNFASLLLLLARNFDLLAGTNDVFDLVLFHLTATTFRLHGVAIRCPHDEMACVAIWSPDLPDVSISHFHEDGTCKLFVGASRRV